jgi:hypothetical protein
MKIVTLTCPDCGTIVAGNVLERHRLMPCPGLDCDRELGFADLPATDRRFVENNAEQFRIEG